MMAVSRRYVTQQRFSQPNLGILWIHKRIGFLWQCNSGVIILFLLLFVWGKKKNCWNRRSWVFFLFQQRQDCDHLSIKILRIEKVQLSREEEETEGHLDREKIQWRRWVWDWFAGGRAIDGDTWRMHSRQLCNCAATLRGSSKGSVQACCCSKSSGMKSVTSPPTHCLSVSQWSPTCPLCFELLLKNFLQLKKSVVPLGV